MFREGRVKMNIVICDDEEYIVDKVYRIVDEYLDETGMEYDIYTYSSGDAAIASGIAFDIAFLDVEMEGLDGLHTAKRLYRKNPNLIVLIITSFDSYLDDAMELSVYRYIDKPIEEIRLHNCISGAVKKYLLASKPIEVKCGRDIYRVNSNDIVYIAIEDKSVCIHTYDRTLRTTKPFEKWKEELDPFVFAQPHRSFLINFNYLLSFNKQKAVLKCNDKIFEVYTSHRKYGEFKKAFNRYISATR